MKDIFDIEKYIENFDDYKEVKKYNRIPSTIEAIQWDGTYLGIFKIRKFCKSAQWVDKILYIPTLEGNIVVSKNDYIIKEITGGFYSCKPDVFKKIYKEVENDCI